MNGDNPKEGISVKQMEEFTKKNRIVVFFCALFILAMLFSPAFWGAGWSILAAGVGGALGALFASKVEFFIRQLLHFVLKQAQMTQLVLAIVGLIIAILLSPLIFLLLGCSGGKNLRHLAAEIDTQHHS